MYGMIEELLMVAKFVLGSPAAVLFFILCLMDWTVLAAFQGVVAGL